MLAGCHGITVLGLVCVCVFFRRGFHRELIEAYGMQLSCFRIIQSDFPFQNRSHTHTQPHKNDNNELTTTKYRRWNIISSVLMKWFHLFRVYDIPLDVAVTVAYAIYCSYFSCMTTKTIEIFNQLMVTDDGNKSPSISR